MKIIHLAALLTSTCLGAASVALEGSSAEDNFAATLEYRRARVSDHVRREHGFEDAAVFVAARPQSEDPDEVHWKNPRVVAGWLRVSSDNRGAIKAYKKSGFVDRGAAVPEKLRGFEGIFHFIHNFVYTFNASTPSFVSSNNDDDDDSLPYLKRSVMKPFFSELIEEGIADEVHSNSSSLLVKE
ncbi:hypothetical protein FOZ60_013264 [Perkinsus olseni]|uniref:Uncharacterized protein n=1 Tax=Perkinsus olseni TaxID=32597 RepID=A0A7J6N9G8_PEROL|nr:hypothetical protein FOZ60_013264 [Perkinsus olseni]